MPSRSKPVVSKSQSLKPLVSVVIPTYNELSQIGICLDSLKHQTYKPIEIIVVDDGSTDGTVKLLKKQTQLTLLTQKHLGPGTARNKAARKAKGEILVFVDADMTFEPDFIDQLTLPIRQGKTIGTFSKEEYVANMENPWARAWSLLRGFAHGKMHPANYPDQQAVFRAITKSAFDQAGGFDTTQGYDDDWSLAERVGRLATVASGAKFYHYNPSSPGEIYLQAKWMSKRNYKFGMIGVMSNIVRRNPLVSLIKGLWQIFRHQELYMLPAQFIYDWGHLQGLFNLGQKTK